MLRKQSGFTIVELLAAMSLMFILSAIALPQFSVMKGQLEVSRDVRMLAVALSEVRAEALRLRTEVRVNFDSNSISWDIYDDGSDEGTFEFDTESAWIGSVPSDIVFNGLGLCRAIAGTRTISMRNRGQSLSLTINQNGYVAI